MKNVWWFATVRVWTLLHDYIWLSFARTVTTGRDAAFESVVRAVGKGLTKVYIFFFFSLPNVIFLLCALNITGPGLTAAAYEEYNIVYIIYSIQSDWFYGTYILIIYQQNDYYCCRSQWLQDYISNVFRVIYKKIKNTLHFRIRRIRYFFFLFLFVQHCFISWRFDLK